MTRRLNIILVLFLICMVACKQEAGLSKKDIQGDWMIALAKRDGKPTVMLQNVYLNISMDSIHTNLNESGEDLSSIYTIKGHSIIQNDQRFYDVDGLSDSTLLISTSIMGRDFEMLFLRSE